MQTLIINGSPHKTGDTMTLVNEMNKHLLGEKRIIHTYYDKIRPALIAVIAGKTPVALLMMGCKRSIGSLMKLIM